MAIDYIFMEEGAWKRGKTDTMMENKRKRKNVSKEEEEHAHAHEAI